MKKTLLSLSLLVILVACQKKSKDFPINFNDPAFSEISENIMDPIDEKTTQEILNLIEFKLGDPIVLDSPKRFIEISILFTLYQYSNYTIASKSGASEEDFNTILNNKRDEFYQKLGISENEYIEYSISNTDKIQEFLTQNPELANAYDLSFSQVID